MDRHVRSSIEHHRFIVATDNCEISLGDLRALVEACEDLHEDSRVGVAAWVGASQPGRFKRIDVSGAQVSEPLIKDVFRVGSGWTPERLEKWLNTARKTGL